MGQFFAERFSFLPLLLVVAQLFSQSASGLTDRTGTPQGRILIINYSFPSMV
jgi:hypothetical protein